ncbi:uncharacterized protein EI97DRAFT_212601 [Westerdykella ornata]|uniref:Uncharacterized protein n=1 Tax=Westerdykella ornata TaxID=318751 RepID=A0A6A6JAZ3_WESOR|nr:uncharacterized protein EI97DRAFT_212601 [Westerdykella ornata]KAF2272369.1 hypothetical protein EI97DRAFT_212601 [Westerdykella ornata]
MVVSCTDRPAFAYPAAQPVPTHVLDSFACARRECRGRLQMTLWRLCSLHHLVPIMCQGRALEEAARLGEVILCISIWVGVARLGLGDIDGGWAAGVGRGVQVREAGSRLLARCMAFGISISTIHFHFIPFLSAHFLVLLQGNCRG